MDPSSSPTNFLSSAVTPRNRDFRLFWIGQSISGLGNQFQTVAGVWLVITLTGDPLTLGVLLALGGIPQAICSFFGGALIDRYSPRRVMLLADLLRLVFSAFLAAVIFSGSLEIWMLFVYALVQGASSGIFEPASSAILPHLLSETGLKNGNMLIQGSTQVIGVLGPLLAAGLIAVFPNAVWGAAVLVALNSLTFLVSLISLRLMQMGGETGPLGSGLNFVEMMRSTRKGISYVYHSPSQYFIFLIIAIATFCFGGPVMVGIPYLAETRFPQGVAAYGLIVSSFAAGNVLGIILSNRLLARDKIEPRILFTGIFIAFGIGLAALAWISTTWLAALDLFLMGMLNGTVSIHLLTGLQRSTPQEMLGRVMSVVIFANMAFMPFSQAIAGALLRWNVEILFLGASALMIGAAIYIHHFMGKNNIGDRFIE